MTDDEILAKAKELYEEYDKRRHAYKTIHDVNIRDEKLFMIEGKLIMEVPKLIALAEKRGAMLVEAEAQILMANNAIKYTEAIEAARRELGIEENKWKHIGKEEIEGVDQARLWLEDLLRTEAANDNDCEVQSLTKMCEVLRRLISKIKTNGE